MHRFGGRPGKSLYSWIVSPTGVSARKPFSAGLLTLFLEHIMNIYPISLDKGEAGAAPRRGGRGPAGSAAVERREAPHPYVIGVHAPSPRRVADRASVRRALAEAPGASRRSISLVSEGAGKRGKGDARRPKTRVPRAA